MHGDEELEDLARRARHDAGAFGQLFDRLYEPIYRYIRSQVRSDPLAEDLSGDVFLQALRGIGRYRRRHGGIRAWLFRIARNDVIDHHRRSHRVTLSPLDETVHEPADPADRFGQTDEADRLRRAIDGLPPDQRDVVLLRFTADLSCAEIGRLIGRSEGAVKLLQHRALKKLRARLSESDGDGTDH